MVSISTTSLPNGTVGQHYSVAVKAIHGCTPYRWWISGTLPSGLVASPSPATTYDLVHGTPAQVGSSTFSVTVRGCGGHISSHRYTVSIAPAQTAHSVSLKWRHTLTLVIQDSDRVLSYRVTPVGGLARPAGRLGVVLRYSPAVEVHGGELGLSSHVSLLSPCAG